jgi:exodeoxyribonuclease V alpha subunit
LHSSEITTKKEEAISLIELLQQALLVLYKAINGKLISVPFNREKYNLHDVKKHFKVNEDKFVLLPDNDVTLSSVMCALKNKKNLLVIGAAGTGKTTIIKNICQRLQANKTQFMVCAPTNNAAKLIGEGLSKTINSVFKYNVKKTINQFNN